MFKHKKNLITFLSILLIVGFLLTSLASYFISLASLRDQMTHGELPLTSDTVYSEIQRDLLRPIFISSLMASDTFLRDWVINEEQNHDAVIRYLTEIKQTYNTITSFFVSDQTRNYYHPDGLVKQVQEAEERDSWYFRVQKMSDDFEINVDIDQANNDTMTVFINYRVHDYKGNFIGATGVGLAVDAVQKLIDQYQETYNRDIFLIDRQGNIKLSNTSDKQRQQQTAQLNIFLKSKEFLTQMTSTETVALQSKIDGHPISLNTRFIKEFDWYLVVIQSELEGTAKLLQTLLINLLFCAVVTTIILFIINRVISSYQEDIEHMATTDKLTGLYNRQALDLLVNPILLDQSRKPENLSLLLLDIDHFKEINDTYGHLAGDAVLKNLARLITSRLRKTDIICRWGGEEFLMLLKGCTLDTASNMAEELRLAVINNPTSSQNQTLPITVSIGVAQYQPEDTRDKLIGKADRALYQAKANGRNRVVSA